MMIQKIRWIFGLMFVLVFSISAAQEGYPLPESLPVITAENAANLTELASIGSSLPDGLEWSPDGQTLAVGLTDKVLLYDVNDLSQPVQTLPPRSANASNATSEPIFSPSGQIEIIHNGNIVQLAKSRDDSISLSILERHTFKELIFSPDESRVILMTSYELDGYPAHDLSLWDIETGALVSDLPTMLEYVSQVDFHAEGQWVVVGTVTGAPYGDVFEEVLIWNAETGESVEVSFGSTSPIKFSPDGKLLAFINHSLGGVMVWSDHPLGVVPMEYQEEQTPNFDFISNGLVIRNATQITIWDLHPDAVEAPFATQRFTIPSDSETRTPQIYGEMLAVYDAKTVSVWDLVTQAVLTQFQAPAEENIVSLNQDFTRVVTVQSGISQSIWDIASGQRLAQIGANETPNLAWTYAAGWQDSRTVKITNLETGEITEQVLLPDYIGWGAGFSPTSALMVFLGEGETFTVYNVESGEIVAELPNPYRASGRFSPDGRYFWVDGISMPIMGDGGSEVSVAVWDTQELDAQEPLSVTLESNRTLLFSPDSHFISQIDERCGYGGGQVRLIDALTGLKLGFDRFECGPNSQAFTADNKQLVVGEVDTLHIYDVAQLTPQTDGTLQPVSSVALPIGQILGQISNINFSADGRFIALGSSQHDEMGTILQVIVYAYEDILAAKVDAPLLSIPDATSAVLSPDGRWVFTNVGIWDSTTGQQVAPLNGWNINVAFNLDGTLAVVSDYQTLSLLSLGDSVQILTTWNIPANGSFSPDGTRLYVASRGKIQVFGVTEG